MASVSGRSVQGRRDYQEDAFRIIRQNEDDVNSDTLIIVCDGMGGHAGGDLAANTVADTFGEAFLASHINDPASRFDEALNKANAALARLTRKDPELKGMGCTLVAALILQRKLVWISVGDSHLYLQRDYDVRKLNADHSMMGEFQELIAQGKMTADQAASHPKRNSLRSAITGGSITLVDQGSMQLGPDDIVVVATDGLDTVPPPEVRHNLIGASGQSSAEISDLLIDLVEQKAKPNQDNTTVVVLKKGGGESRETFFVPRLQRKTGYMLWAILAVALLLMIIVGILLWPSDPDDTGQSVEPVSVEPAPPEQETPQDENSLVIPPSSQPQEEEDPSETSPEEGSGGGGGGDAGSTPQNGGGNAGGTEGDRTPDQAESGEAAGGEAAEGAQEGDILNTPDNQKNGESGVMQDRNGQATDGDS